MTEYAYTILATIRDSWSGYSIRSETVEVVATSHKDAVAEALQVLSPLVNSAHEWRLRVVKIVDMRIVTARGKEQEND